MIYTALTANELIEVLDRASSFSEEEKNKVMASAAIMIQKAIDKIECIEEEVGRIEQYIDSSVDSIQEIQNNIL